jgi:signal-transduction protein with cAMP-binding, CBS, and nucleotidyltransferase domain
MLRKIVVPCKDPRNTRVEQIMSTPLILGDPKMDLMEAARLMILKNVKRLPIIENGKLIGIVTLTDVIRSQPQTVDELGKIISFEKMPKRFKKWMKKTRY